jgi:hypothetical protein
MTANISEQKASQSWTLGLSALNLKMKVVLEPLEIGYLGFFLCIQVYSPSEIEKPLET